ncbi:MAG TPA: hypothetical protein PKA58_22025 [Polyangium sp.]|nr:hypothetical protein [Polyangium sp.]
MNVGTQKGRRRLATLPLTAILLLFVAAPTVGDIGSCGEQPVELDPKAFFEKKAALDRERCRECAIQSAACTRARDPKQTPTEFPKGCYPIVHDGDVCLRALEATDCSEYATFVADQGATIPTECNFCPLEGAP